jgi:antitoxin ParD1/3/4
MKGRKIMNVSITPELEQFIHARVQSGMYQSASELVREVLRLLAERDELRKRRIEAMDAFIQVGLDSAARGEFVDPEEMDADLDQLFAEMKPGHA